MSPSRQDVVEQLIPYVKNELKKGTRLNQIMRHTTRFISWANRCKLLEKISK